MMSDAKGDAEREKLLKENEEREISSEEYNERQSEIEQGERERAGE